MSKRKAETLESEDRRKVAFNKEEMLNHASPAIEEAVFLATCRRISHVAQEN